MVEPPWLSWTQSLVRFPCIVDATGQASSVNGNWTLVIPKASAGRTTTTQSIQHLSHLKLCVRRGCRGNIESSKTQALSSEFQSSEGEKTYQKKRNARGSLGSAPRQLG